MFNTETTSALDSKFGAKSLNASRYLVYSDGSKHAVGVPYQREGSCQILGEIVPSEKMGYVTNLFDLDTIFSSNMIN